MKYAETHGNRAAGREFGINKACNRDWCKKKDRLEKLPKNKQADRWSKAHFPEIETESMLWLTYLWHQGIAVSTIEICQQASVIAQRLKVTTFGNSVNWVYSFMRRNDLLVGCHTHIAQRLPEDNEERETPAVSVFYHQREDALMKDWVKSVWGKRPGGLTQRSLLILDSFQCHKTNGIKELRSTWRPQDQTGYHSRWNDAFYNH